jgi:hypothetical protein
MSFILKNLLLCLILFSCVNSELPLPEKNDCSYLIGSDEQPKDKNICLYTSMPNYQSCCYVEYIDDENNTTKKYCMALTENITDSDNYKQNLIDNFAQNDSITEIDCPGLHISNNKINNCGLVGVLEPRTREDCSGISIPESNCCMIELRDGSKMCRRVKKLPKDEDDIRDEVKQDISRLSNSNPSINKIYCSEHFVHLATSILVICLLTVIL